MKLLVLSVGLSGCVTTRVTERYVLPGNATEIQRAAEEATRRLGWTSEVVEAGKFKLLDYPRRPTPPLTISAIDEVLLIEADVAPRQELPEAARILRSATEEVLTGHSPGPRVEERSVALTVALDVLVPAMGALYAQQGDPAFDSPVVGWSRGFLWDLTSRFALDASAGILLAYYAMQRAPTGIFVPVIITEAVLLLTNRILAVVFDVKTVRHRNAYAQSGLGTPGYR